MAFTDNCDLFGSIHEEGLNRVITHLMRKRPSLFNYGTAFVAQNLVPADHDGDVVTIEGGEANVLCEPIHVARDVLLRQNPIIHVLPPIPVIGTDNPQVGLNFCAQITNLAIDFHAGNAIALPPELAPLPEQRFALMGAACVGLGCPPDEDLRKVLTTVVTGAGAGVIAMPGALMATRLAAQDVAVIKDNGIIGPVRDPRTVVLPMRGMMCFCLQVYVVGHFEMKMETVQGKQRPRLLARVDGIEIVDLAPAGLEAILECYLNLVVQLTLLPQLNAAIPPLMFDLTNVIEQVQLPAIVEATPVSPPAAVGVLNNPAIEQDQLMAFITIEKKP